MRSRRSLLTRILPESAPLLELCSCLTTIAAAHDRGLSPEASLTRRNCADVPSAAVGKKSENHSPFANILFAATKSTSLVLLF